MGFAPPPVRRASANRSPAPEPEPEPEEEEEVQEEEGEWAEALYDYDSGVSSSNLIRFAMSFTQLNNPSGSWGSFGSRSRSHQNHEQRFGRLVCNYITLSTNSLNIVLNLYSGGQARSTADQASSQHRTPSSYDTRSRSRIVRSNSCIVLSQVHASKRVYDTGRVHL